VVDGRDKTDHVLALRQEAPIKFQEMLKEKFPVAEPGAILELATIVNGAERIDKQTSVPMYSFRAQDSSKQVVITPSSFSLEFSRYKNFDDFKSDVFSAYVAFQGLYSPLTITRCGLRFINKIKFTEGNPLDWSDYINPDLLKSMDAFSESKPDISRMMSQICLNKDSYNLNFNFGIYNAEFPGKVSRREFILDYDCFTKECSSDGVEKQLTTFGTEIQKMFEKSIMPNLRTVMEKKS